MGGQNSTFRGCCLRIKGSFTGENSSNLNPPPLKILNNDKLENVPLTREQASREQVSSDPNSLHTFLNCSYQRGDEIGSGPHGTVYEALCLENGEILATKKIMCIAEERRKIYLYLEGKLMNLNHENLMKYIDIYESVENPNDLYIISRLISGCSLREALKKFPQFEEKIVRVFCKEILSGLEYLNKHKIYHSNLKPNNIMIEANGHIKLNDFFTISKKLLIHTDKTSQINFTY